MTNKDLIVFIQKPIPNEEELRFNNQSVVFSLFLGIGSAIGIVNMYYINSIITKKYESKLFLKCAVLFTGASFCISDYISLRVTSSIESFDTLVIISMIAIILLLVILALSPLFMSNFLYNDWAKDSEKSYIYKDDSNIFNKYMLSKRESEVCSLLLKGYTLRQISATLSIAYSTVNTYCTCLYRKLNINSRTELLILFKDYIN